MLDKQQIEIKLDEKIEKVELIKETGLSFLYRITGEKKYILKESKNADISEEFYNHKKVYDCWAQNRQGLDFKIPQVYFLADDKKSYLMDYIEAACNLLESLQKKRPAIMQIFQKAGLCVNQYHTLMTKALEGQRQSIFDHDSFAQIIQSKDGHKIKNHFNQFPDESFRTIFKDFSLSNVIVDKNNDIYFVDFQKIYYYAPFYYDLARFIDTGKVFSLAQKPLFFLVNFNKINKILNSFIDGYGAGVDKTHLKTMCYIHRKEHIQMKKNVSSFDALILQIIYWLI